MSQRSLHDADDMSFFADRQQNSGMSLTSWPPPTFLVSGSPGFGCF